MKNKYISYSFLLIIILGCKEVKKENHENVEKAIKVNDIDKSIEVYTINKDGVKNGDYVLYSHDSTKVLEANFSNGLKNGIEKKFYHDGSVEYIGNYKNGKEDSLWTWFYPDRGVEIMGYWYNGIPWGDKIGRFPSGKIDYVAYYNIDGEAIFMREYNEEGKIIKSEGVPVQVIVNKYRLLQNDSFELKILLSAYNGYTNHFDISVINKETKEKEIWARNISIESLAIGKHSKIDVIKRKMISIGEYIILIKGIVLDTSINDSILYEHRFDIVVQ